MLELFVRKTNTLAVGATKCTNINFYKAQKETTILLLDCCKPSLRELVLFV